MHTHTHLLPRRQNQQTKIHIPYPCFSLNESLDNTQPSLGQDILVIFQAAQIYRTPLAVTVHLIKVAVFVRLDETNVMEVDFCFGTCGDG